MFNESQFTASKLSEIKEKIPLYVKKWSAEALSTERANRPIAEDAIRSIYKIAGYLPPKIVWCDSPIQMRENMYHEKDRGSCFRDTIVGNKMEGISAYRNSSPMMFGLISQIQQKLESFESCVSGFYYNSPDEGIQTHVFPGDRLAPSPMSAMSAVEDTIMDNEIGPMSKFEDVRDIQVDMLSNKDEWEHFARNVVTGYHPFFAMTEMIEVELGIASTPAAKALENLAKSAGWFIPYSRVCFISERPSILEVNEDGRIHSESGPAVCFADGFKLFAIGGVIVESDIILDPLSITADRIKSQTNAEIRRIMMDKFGVSRYVEETGAERIDADFHEHHGFRVLIASKEKMIDRQRVSRNGMWGIPGGFNRFDQMAADSPNLPLTQWLNVGCPSTGRTYFMEVPPNVKTCEEADRYLKGPSVIGRCVGRT